MTTETDEICLLSATSLDETTESNPTEAATETDEQTRLLAASSSDESLEDFKTKTSAGSSANTNQVATPPVPGYSSEISTAGYSNVQLPAYTYNDSNTTVLTQPMQQFEAAPANIPKRPHNFMFIAVFACICCFWPTAIVALVYASQVNSQYNTGNYTGAERSSDKVYYWTKVSIAVGVGIAIAVVSGFSALISYNIINNNYDEFLK